MVELGISSFGETTVLEAAGQIYSHDERIRQLVAEIELADKVGLDVYGIGEHHREDFAVSAPEIVLAAGAVNTKKIRLTSAVSILSSMDPIRLFQQYATIDALSNGRAEIMAGAIDSKHCWKRSLSPSSSGQIAILGGDRWSCRVNSEDCSGGAADCLCDYWWQSALF